MACGVVLTATAAVLVATPAGALPGLSVATATTFGPDAFGVHTAVATCPPGTQLTGGGGLPSGSSWVRLEGVIPQGGGQSMLAAGIGPGNTLTTSLTAYAICASGMSGYEIVQAETQGPVNGFIAEAWAICPAGKRVIGGGGHSATTMSYVLDAIWYSPDLTRVYVRSVRQPDAVAGTAPLARAYAICIDPVPGQQRVTATTDFQQRSTQTISVLCPGGTRVHGLGAITGGGAGNVGMASLQPTSPSTLGGTNYRARVSPNLKYTGFWKAEVHAVCAP